MESKRDILFAIDNDLIMTWKVFNLVLLSHFYYLNVTCYMSRKTLFYIGEFFFFLFLSVQKKCVNGKK